MEDETTPSKVLSSTEAASEELQCATEDTYQNHVNAPRGRSTDEAILKKGLRIRRNILAVSSQLDDVSIFPHLARLYLADVKVIHLLLWSGPFFSSEIDHIKSMTRCGVTRHRNTKWAHDPTTRRALAVFIVCEL